MIEQSPGREPALSALGAEVFETGVAMMRAQAAQMVADAGYCVECGLYDHQHRPDCERAPMTADELAAEAAQDAKEAALGRSDTVTLPAVTVRQLTTITTPWTTLGELSEIMEAIRRLGVTVCVRPHRTEAGVVDGVTIGRVVEPQERPDPARVTADDRAAAVTAEIRYRERIHAAAVLAERDADEARVVAEQRSGSGVAA